MDPTNLLFGVHKTILMEIFVLIFFTSFFIWAQSASTKNKNVEKINSVLDLIKKSKHSKETMLKALDSIYPKFEKVCFECEKRTICPVDIKFEAINILNLFYGDKPVEEKIRYYKKVNSLSINLVETAYLSLK